jgi:sugar phosphate isomerase/epimerase
MWKTFAFENHFGQADRDYSVSERWDIVKEVGFDKIWLTINFDLPESIKRMKAIPTERRRTGLGVVAYTVINLKMPFSETDQVFDLMEHLQAGDTLELGFLTEWRKDTSDPSYDPKALEILAKVLGRAEAMDLTVSLYHHYGFWMEQLEDCIRLVHQMNHPRLKITFCASHWYCFHYQEKEQTSLLRAAIHSCQPWLHHVNICGSRPTPVEMDYPLPTTVEPVGEGDFDNQTLLTILHEINFSGLIGFQGFSIGGDPRRKLQTSFNHYRRMLASLAADR